MRKHIRRHCLLLHNQDFLEKNNIHRWPRHYGLHALHFRILCLHEPARTRSLQLLHIRGSVLVDAGVVLVYLCCGNCRQRSRHGPRPLLAHARHDRPVHVLDVHDKLQVWTRCHPVHNWSIPDGASYLLHAVHARDAGPDNAAEEETLCKQ